MKLMIFKCWVSLTLYASMCLNECSGGAQPYLQQNAAPQNQLLTRGPSGLYGTPTVQPATTQITFQPQLVVATQRPLQSQSSQSHMASQQLFQQNILQPQRPQGVQQQQRQQQQQQRNNQQQQHESIRELLPLLVAPPPVPNIPNQRQPVQHQQQYSLPPISFERPKAIADALVRETPLLFQPKQSAPAADIFNIFPKNQAQQQQQQPQQHQQQPQQHQHQQQQQHRLLLQPSTQQPYRLPAPTLPPLVPSPLPPLQPGPSNNRIFSTSGAADGDAKIASNHIVVENYSTQDSDSFLNGAKNSTLYAAQLLAKSLLEASNENDASSNISNPQLNKTDLVVVKTQKKAYIIPMNLQGHKLNQSQAQELYQNRDKLPVAYTVNQFLFIIKPENVNFLNKLV